ncbi:hypothetical protein [Leucobacter sp.]
MSDSNPPGPPPGAPGSPEAPFGSAADPAPPPFTTPGFGPFARPAPPTSQPPSALARIVWIAVTAAVLVGGIAIASEAIRGFDEFGGFDGTGGFGDVSSCEWDHEPTAAELEVCTGSAEEEPSLE